MSALTETQRNTNSLPSFLSRLRINGAMDAVSWLVMGGAAILLIAYLVIAISWQQQPFVGAMFTHNLVIEDVGSLTGDDWPLLNTGIEPGYTVVGMGELNTVPVEWPENERAEGLRNALRDFEAGDTVTVVIGPSDNSMFNSDQCTQLATDSNINCDVVLGSLSTRDFVLHFGVGYLAGLVAFVIGFMVFIRRRESQAAKFFAIAVAALAIMLAGRLDLMSSFTLAPAWIVANYLFAAMTVSFALTFPSELGIVWRVPSLRYAPVIVGLALATLSIYLYQDTAFDAALLLPLAISLVAIVTLLYIMWQRRQYSSSPIVREQSAFVGLGAMIAFTPLLAWIAYFVVTGGGMLDPLTPVMQITALLFPLSASYAILQYRLLPSDRVIPEFIVYNLMGAILIAGYFLIVTGSSLFLSDAITADNPLFVAATIGFVVLVFTPVRNYLRSSIDKVMFRQRRNFEQRQQAYGSRLTDAADLDKVYTVLQDELADTVAPSIVFLFVYDSKTGTYVPWPDPATKRTNTDIAFAQDGGLVRYLREEQSVLYLEQGQPLPMTVSRDRSQLAVISTPLILRLPGREQLNGFLAIGEKRNGEAYTFEELRFVESVAEQTALAVERARFVTDLEHQIEIQDVLSQVSRALNFAIDFDTLLELIYAQTSRIIEADHFYIVLRDPSTNELFYSFYSVGDERLYELEGLRWIMGNDVISEVARRQIPMRLENFTAEQIRRDPSISSMNMPDLYAWMGVPLASDTSGVGGLGVMATGSSDPTHAFTDEQFQLFRDVASIGASAIDKTQLFAKTELRAQQLKALNDISSSLASELADLDRLLNLITENAVSILGCEAGSLLLVDEATGDLVFRVVTGGGGHNLLGTRINRGEPSLVTDAVEKVETLIVNDPAHDDRWHGEVTEDEGSEHFVSRAILTLPLLAQGEAVGALQLINKKDGSGFNDEDAALATTFSGQAAIAIQNARLIETQDQQLLARMRELEAMAELDHDLGQTLILERLGDTILRWALDRTDADHGAIFLLDEDREHVTLIRSYGYEAGSIFFLEENKPKTLPRTTGILSRVLDSSLPTMVQKRDMASDPHYVESLPSCVAQIAVPLITGAEVTGALLVETDREGVLGLLALDVLSRLADRASASLANAQLFSQLEEQQAARSEFVRIIAHELGNPLTSMKGYTSLLVRGMVGELSAQQSQFIETVHRNIKLMEHLVADMRDAEASDLALNMSAVSFRPIVEEAFNTAKKSFEDKGQSVDMDVPEDLPDVWGDETRLQQVMLNFLTNANKYTEDDGVVEVRAVTRDNEWDPKGAERVLHISVKDNGLGISPEDLERLFEKYFRSTNQKALKQKGTGLGLALTRRLIEAHGGKIWVESELNVGTTFHFTIPLASEVISERM